jgi:hypothetical protein
MLVALSAVLIGACALVVSVVQVQIMRAEQHASVWPRIHISQRYAEGGSLGVSVVNPGIGPAVIKHVRVTIDGTPRKRWADIIEALVPGVAPRDLAITAIANRIVSSGESVALVYTADPAFADAFATAMHRLTMEICYCSVYDDCWIVSNTFGEGSALPGEVGGCPGAGDDTFVD